MQHLKRILSLPDRAAVLYFAIKELGNPSFEQLMDVTGKSLPTIYRGISDLRKADLLGNGEPKPRRIPDTSFTVKDELAS